MSKKTSNRSHKKRRRRRSIFQILHPTKSEPPPTKSNHKHHRSSSTKFEKLKSIISSLFPKKSVGVKPKKSIKPRPRKKRSRSFSFNRKKNKKNKKQSKYTHETSSKHKRTTSCVINIPTMDYISENEEIQTIKPNAMNMFLEDIEEEPDNDSSSDTEEYKDDLSDRLPRDKLQLAPRSSSFMRSFEKRPEYITYYPPASLIDAFNTITVDEEERSVTVEMKSGTKQRISAVDQLFELASMPLDYSNFYGYEGSVVDNDGVITGSVIDNNDEYELNEPSEHVDGSVLSSFAEDYEYNEYNEYNETLSWQ